MKLKNKILSFVLTGSVAMGAFHAQKSEALIIGLSTGGTGLVIAGGASIFGGISIAILSEGVANGYSRQSSQAFAGLIAVTGIVLDGDSLDLSSSKLATIEEQLEKNGYFKARGQREKIMAELKHFSNAIDAFEKGQTAVCQNYELKDCRPKALNVDLVPLKDLSNPEQVASIQKSIQDQYGFVPSENISKLLLDLQSSLRE